MSQLPNYQARLARALRNNLSPESSVSVFHRFKWFTLAVAILIPIYPSLAALGQISEIQAGDYDPSSILFEYIDTGDLSPGYISDTGLVRVDLDTISGSHIAEPPPVEDAKPSDEPIPASTMRMYTVVEHDDIMKIAKNYQIDYEVILWMNDISLSDNLKEGQQLRIPSISGVIHTLRRGETVSDIAKTYNVPSSEILAANSITDPTRIRDGRKLLVPGATRPTPPPPPTPTQKPAPAPAPKPTTSATPVASTPAADTENYAAEIPIEYTPSEAIASAAAAANLKERYVVNYTGNGR